MILKRAAASILAVVFLFQALCPSWTFRPQCWQSVDVRIGLFWVQARTGIDSVCFEGLAGEGGRDLLIGEAAADITAARAVEGSPRAKDLHEMTAALRNGAALVRILRAILHDEHTILTVSSRVASVRYFYLCRDHRSTRRSTRTPMALSSSEQAALESSIKAVQTNITTLSEMIPI